MRTARKRTRRRVPVTASPPGRDQTPAYGAHDPGRAWINGAEVGGPDPRYAHLDRSYD
jgi:hypothetical protein